MNKLIFIQIIKLMLLPKINKLSYIKSFLWKNLLSVCFHFQHKYDFEIYVCEMVYCDGSFGV